jgi:hypothetical protein
VNSWPYPNSIFFASAGVYKYKHPGKYNVERMDNRQRAVLTWDAVPDATGYVIYWGIDEESLNLSAMMHGAPDYELRALNT